MKILTWLIITSALFVSAMCSGARFPVLNNPRIDRCIRNCTEDVAYTADSITIEDVVTVGAPFGWASRLLIAIGVHCNDGSSITGEPFTGCYFTGSDGAHAPKIKNCTLSSTESWDVTPGSTCQPERSTWAFHRGAGPGGECVLFVQANAWDSQSAHTIYGTVTPSMVANSGNSFCQKALPPNVTCNITLPATLDHGVINTSEHSVISVDGSVDCGSNPVLTIIGGGKLVLGSGVSTEITMQMIGSSRVHLTSTLDAINASPGDYRGLAIVVASPN